MFSQDAEVWPDFRLDLTEIALVFDLSGGAPYVLGLVSGYDLGKEWHSAGCRQHSSVYRWDDQVDAFKRVDAVERQSVLSYYYTHVEKPCP